MNSDEVGSLARKVLLVVLSAAATKYHIDNNTVAAVASDLADLAVVGWGVYAHWNMKKVPENVSATQQAGGR